MIKHQKPGSFITQPGDTVDFGGAVAGATITVGAEVSDVRPVSIQLKDGQGKNIAFAAEVEIVMLLNTGGTDYVATGGSTGLAIGASGKLQTLITKKRFHAISTTAGLIALIWTDIGTEVAYLGVKLPGGRMVVSAALTNS